MTDVELTRALEQGELKAIVNSTYGDIVIGRS